MVQSKRLTIDDVFSKGWRARKKYQDQVKRYCAEIAHSYKKQFLGTMVYSYDNEWYASRQSSAMVRVSRGDRYPVMDTDQDR
jgi:hypothetical protein